MNSSINFRHLALVISASFILTSCTGKKFTVNIPSTFEGYIYIISVLDSGNSKSINLDSSGLVFVPNYCKGDITLEITVDGKPVQPELSYTESSFVSGHENGISYSVSYTTFFFRLGQKRTMQKDSIQ